MLDQHKGDPSTYKDRANALADTQKKLAGDLDQIHQTSSLAHELDSAFAQISGDMKDVETILQKPETGKPADDAEGQDH